MQFRNISPLQLPGGRSMQENQTKQLMVLLILLSLFLRMHTGILIQHPFAELLPQTSFNIPQP